MKKLLSILLLCLPAFYTFAQEIAYQNQRFELRNVKASLETLGGKPVLKVERDLEALPFDVNNLSKTVDEPTYVKLKGVDFENGVIDVKVLSRIQNPSPFENAQGFIGVALRISERDSAYESIYLRPKAGSSDNQFARNHTVQYYSYPNYKFDKLRNEPNGSYETYADIGLDEWIDMRIEVAGNKATLYINGQKRPSFIIEKMKGSTTHGEVALWVDIGTIGYFKDLKIIKQ
ncbi:polysaccharide lyase family 7 protein [Mucilaginibacter sp. 14171R-50]|uniref:polysaccharide lyase family 7 protein n=1 Tax=Mucilaginibacter sp. 14171R-50 TaxID=2703789 RepID=UPI00138C46F3|nr:polysaccharide lyase family 7 protein [Mucilaginibacter sp. 14171R-50]QHS55626.1 polysaccharide lyase family 7 protein [Mucilaginibacter sp. 14171R-50]